MGIKYTPTSPVMAALTGRSGFSHYLFGSISRRKKKTLLFERKPRFNCYRFNAIQSKCRLRLNRRRQRYVLDFFFFFWPRVTEKPCTILALKLCGIGLKIDTIQIARSLNINAGTTAIAFRMDLADWFETVRRHTIPLVYCQMFCLSKYANKPNRINFFKIIYRFQLNHVFPCKILNNTYIFLLFCIKMKRKIQRRR